MLYICIPVAVCLAEILIKKQIEKKLQSGEKKKISVFPGNLEKHHNYGLAGNKLENNRKLVKGISLAAFGVLLICFLLLLPSKGKKGLKIGAALVIGGGLSNILDRFFRGYVVDYVRLKTPFGWLNRFIFNIADFCLFTGAVIMLFSSLWHGTGKTE